MEAAADQKDPCLRTLTVTIPWEVVERERRDYVRRARPSVKLPGFRRGRVPDGVLNQHMKHEISIALTERLAPEALSEKIRGMDVKLAAAPYVTHVRFTEGESLEISAAYEVFPPFELGEYRGLSVLYEAEEVTDEHVQAEIERLRLRHAPVRTLDPRPVEIDDYVSVTFSSVEDSGWLPFFDREAKCQVSEDGEPFSRPFVREIMGLEPGAETEISCQLPADYPLPELAGTTVKCSATVHSILQYDLPAVDDELAKDVNSEFKCLEDLRVAVRQDLETRTALAARARTEGEIMYKLAESHPMDLPKQHFQDRLQRLAAELERREGNSPAARQLTPQRANQEVLILRTEQVLDRIADVEGITVDAADLQEEVQRWAQAEQVTLERAHLAMESSGMLHQAWIERRRAKAMQVVIDAGVPAETTEAPDSGEAGAEIELAEDASRDE